MLSGGCRGARTGVARVAERRLLQCPRVDHDAAGCGSSPPCNAHPCNAHPCNAAALAPGEPGLLSGGCCAGSPGCGSRFPYSAQAKAVPAGLRWCDARLFARGSRVAHALATIALLPRRWVVGRSRERPRCLRLRGRVDGAWGDSRRWDYGACCHLQLACENDDRFGYKGSPQGRTADLVKPPRRSLA